MASQRWARRTAMAKAAGFPSVYAFNKARATNPRIQDALSKAGNVRGPARYYLGGLAAHTVRLPGRKGSKQRGKAVAEIVGKIVKAGGNPNAFLEAIGSPRRKKGSHHPTKGRRKGG